MRKRRSMGRGEAGHKRQSNLRPMNVAHCCGSQRWRRYAFCFLCIAIALRKDRHMYEYMASLPLFPLSHCSHSLLLLCALFCCAINAAIDDVWLGMFFNRKRERKREREEAAGDFVIWIKCTHALMIQLSLLLGRVQTQVQIQIHKYTKSPIQLHTVKYACPHTHTHTHLQSLLHWRACFN